MTSRKPIRVAAAIIVRDGEYLLSRRPEGSHLSGYWEFPGGKIESGETPAGALERELREELGVDAVAGGELAVLTHAYPEKTVELIFMETTIRHGRPRPLEVAEVGWFRPEEMEALPILPADLPLVGLLASRADGGARPARGEIRA